MGSSSVLFGLISWEACGVGFVGVDGFEVGGVSMLSSVDWRVECDMV